MKKIWWTWDIRMHWAHGFCLFESSYLENYKRMADAAAELKVDGIVIWGFLRDSHGGIDAARKLVDYAYSKGIDIYPGVGVDSYGGVFYDGNSKYSLDKYLAEHPEARALDENGAPRTYAWPPSDGKRRYNACPSNQDIIPYYQESLEWLLEKFELKGFQIEQGDTGLCFCDKCRSRKRITTGYMSSGTCSASDSSVRIPTVLAPVLKKHPGMTVLSETYAGLTGEELQKLGPFLGNYQPEIYISWQLYDGPVEGRPGNMKIDESISSPTPHGCAAIRTNNDIFQGEIDDSENIRTALRRSIKAGLDMTYIYGEYPACWPVTGKNYAAWLEEAAGNTKELKHENSSLHTD